MKKSIRGMGIGLFLAGALFTIVDISDGAPDGGKEAFEQEIAVLQRQLAEANEEIASLKEAAPSQEKSGEGAGGTTDGQSSSAAQAGAGEGKVTAATIYIYEGVSPYDIGKQAEDAGIIANGRELELFLSKPEYAHSIQIGQFELNAGMSIEEMAKMLTGRKMD